MGKRRYGSVFPVARIKKMMQTDEDVGKIATGTPLLVSKALELVIEDVLRQSRDIAVGRNARTVTPQHLKECVNADDTFDFLRANLAKVPDVEQQPVERKNSKREALDVSAGAEQAKKKRPRAPRPPTPRGKTNGQPEQAGAKPPQISEDQKALAEQYAIKAAAAQAASGMVAGKSNEDDDYDDEEDDEGDGEGENDDESKPSQPGAADVAPKVEVQPNKTDPQAEGESARISVSSLLS